ncbi:Hypothetical protein CAP_0625 [Chondromyces apiculatus DSM 436]|uniref:Uncharacterized protein n=2 Tax=Chondromyces apiculatus TaxID=51 RepID=A0A017TEY7_9BACT|nr:Hypothetical protein CAP_0625 [Chondromyces apiculatus DSM 436]
MPRYPLGALLMVTAVALAPTAARAQVSHPTAAEAEATPPEVDPRPVEIPTPPPAPGGSNPHTALVTGASVLGGLGVVAFMAAGISWLVAANDAAKLDEECPSKICYEDSPGGEHLVRARGAERASVVLVGVGTPLLAGGLVMSLFSTAFRRSGTAVNAAPVVGPSFAGGTLRVTF